MQLKKLFNDDNAVSPVIGVILMVAITVILAAVIASFVLGLGSTSDSVQPNASFSTNYGDESVTITLTDGDSLDFDELFIRGDGVDDGEDGPIEEFADSGTNDEWSIGSSVVLEAGEFAEDGDVNLVWEEAGGDGSATLFTFETPGPSS